MVVFTNFMEKYLFKLLSITLLFYACSSSIQKKDSIEKIEEIPFHSGFISGNVQIELFNNEEYICFGDYKTHKKIAMHGLQSQKKHLVDLSKVIKSGEKILAYEVVNLDTIFVLPYYSNKLYCINREGTIWKEVDLNPYLGGKDKYELQRSSTPFLYDKSTFIFSLDYVPQKNKGDNHFTTLMAHRHASPMLFKVENIFSEKPKTSFGLDSLYTHFMSNIHVNIEGNRFSFLNNRIFFQSAYSDSLYVINSKSMLVKKKIKILSRFSELRIKPLSIDEFLRKSRTINDNFKSNGQMVRFIYNKEKDLYYVFAKHKNKGSETPWSIIILNSDFQKIGEQRIDHKIYNPFGIMTEKGLLIQHKTNSTQNLNNYEKNIYTLFKHH